MDLAQVVEVVVQSLGEFTGGNSPAIVPNKCQMEKTQDQRRRICSQQPPGRVFFEAEKIIEVHFLSPLESADQLKYPIDHIPAKWVNTFP